jgi:hypothetical protein
MAGLGVSKKQTDRARQTFERSAQSAGFFEFGRDKLIEPAHRVSDFIASEAAMYPQQQETERSQPKSGGGGGPTGDPLIDALVLKLPKTGEKWPRAERETWLKMIEMAFDLAYGVEAKPSGPTVS